MRGIYNMGKIARWVFSRMIGLGFCALFIMTFGLEKLIKIPLWLSIPLILLVSLVLNVHVPETILNISNHKKKEDL
jgi:hypothetical protein